MAGYLKYADFDSTLLRFNCIGFYVILDFGFCKKKKNSQPASTRLQVKSHRECKQISILKIVFL